MAGLEITEVAGVLVVMAVGEDGMSERGVWGNVDTTSVGQNMIIEFPVREMRLEDGRDILQGRL